MSGLELATALFDAARATTWLAANWLIQSTLLVGGGLMLSYLLRSRGSAVQSAVYRTTLMAVLVCPLATWGLSLTGISGWSLQMPEAYRQEQIAADAPLSASPPNEPQFEEPAVAPIEIQPALDGLAAATDSGSSFDLDSLESAPTDAQFVDAQLVPPFVDDAAQLASVETDGSPVTLAFNVLGFGFVAAATGALWLLAGGFLLCRLGLAWWRLDRLRRCAWAAERQTLDVCRELAAMLDVSPPEVLHSPYLPSPCLAGLRRPAVLLPEAEMTLPMRDVLVHELAHLRRYDCWWNLLRRVATALLFFQPLLWKLSRRLDSTAEEVCDDFVVQFGGDRRQYAHRLVDIAELSLAPAAAAGVGIVSLRSMLAMRVARIMDTSRSLSTRAGRLLLVIVSLTGLAATLLVGMVGIKPELAAAESSQSADARGIATRGEPDKATSDEHADLNSDNVTSTDDKSEITIRGQVIDENDEPIPNASVRLPDDSDMGGEPVSTNAEGRFQITFDKRKFTKPEWHSEPWRSSRLVATADGFGPAWVEGEELTRTTSHSLKLKRDDVSVRGQILTLEGQPVPHAKLEIWNIYESHSKNLDDMFKTLRDSPAMFQPHMNREMSWFPGNLLELKVERGTLSRGTLSNAGDGNPIVTTDENGQFELRGIGPERMLRLWLQGPDIQSTQINVVTRNEIDPKWQRDDSNEESRRMMDSGAAPPQVHAATFKHFAGPSAPIFGIARDKETGQPIAGIHVGGWLRNTDNHAHAVTDDNGRYELTGLGVEGTFQQLYAGPKEEDRERLPYLGAQKEKISFSVTSPLSEADTAFELTRGIVVRGRVTDAATKKPVKARVEYMSYENNHYVQKLADELWPYAHAMTDEKGEFTVAVLPGPGTLAVWTRLSSSVPDKYRPIDPKAFGMPVDDRGMVSTANNGYVSPMHYKAAQFIDLKPGDTPPVVELTVTPVTDVARVRCVDPEGLPLQGVSVIGHLPWSGDYSPIPNAGLEKERADRIYIEIAELGAESRNPVVLRHRERQLAAILFGSRGKQRPQLDDLKQAKDGAHLLQLLPSASIAGQLIDEEGEPLSSGEVELHFVTGADSPRNSIELGDVPVGKNGRFEIRDLPAGGPYILAGGNPSHGGGILKRDIELVAGQALDLGTINVTKAEPTIPKKAATSDKSQKSAKATSDSSIQGLVVGPDSKPVQGAEVYWLSWRLREQPRKKPQHVATTDADGIFRVTRPAATPVHNQAVELLETQIIAVTGKGFGLAMVNPHQLGRGPAPKSAVGQLVKRLAEGVSPPPMISLPADDVPLRGRIVDIDGAPVADAKVHLREISDPNSDTRAAFRGENVDGEDAVWRRRLVDLLQRFAPPQLSQVISPVTTDADGRFTFRGLGRDRLVELLVDGERIESTLVLVRTENGKPIRVEPDQNYLLLPATIHGAEFTQVVGPSKPLTGRVLDLDTGESIAGAMVRTFKIHSHPLHTTREREYLATTTDTEGRYRITGLPIGNDNKLVALAPQDQPYVPVGHTVDTSADGAEIQQDFRMKRGVWAQGRVYDAQTNEVLTGKFDYYVFRNPKLESEIPGLREAHVDEHYFTDADGNFRIPVLRARGVLGFWYSGPKDAMAYPRGAGAEEIEGAEDQGEGTLKMYPTLPHYLIADNYWKVAEVNPNGSDEVIKVDMALSSGRTATFRVTDASGRPLNNVDVHGKNWGWEQGKGPEIQVIGLQPGQPRKVLAYHPNMKLAGAATISDTAAEPVSINLAASGTIRARLVDEDGEPIGNAKILPDYEAFNSDPNAAVWPYQPGLVMNPTQIPVNKDGTFEIVGLVPGWKYSASAVAPEDSNGRMMDRGIGHLFENVSVVSGQTLDLGNLQPVPYEMRRSKPKEPAAEKPTAQEQATSESKDSESSDQVAIRGRVTGPEGKPISGARIFTPRIRDPEPWSLDAFEQVERARSDNNGAFQFDVPDGDLPKQFEVVPVLAYAPGYGVAGNEVPRGNKKATEALTLQFVEDKIVRGRIIDTEGRPVENAKLQVTILMVPKKGELDKFLTGWLQNWRDAPHGILNRLKIGGPGDFGIATTDADGRFELRGLGADRIAWLQISGAGIAQTVRFLVTRDGVDYDALNQATAQRNPPTLTMAQQVVLLVGPTFEFVAEPGQTITGTVRASDGEPIAGVRMRALVGWDSSVTAATDSTGRYRLSGLRKGRAELVGARAPNDSAFLDQTRQVTDDDDDLMTENIDFVLPRGVVVMGRVVDRETGEGVPAGLRFAPLPGNEYFDKPGYDGFRHSRVMETSDSEGRFRLVTIPGPRMLLVQAHSQAIKLGDRHVSPYRSAEPSDTDVGRLSLAGDAHDRHFECADGSIEFIRSQNAMMYLDNRPDSQPEAVEIKLERGKSIEVVIEGPDGEPLSDVIVAGMTASWPITYQLNDSKCTLYALDPAEPRDVIFLDAKRQLAAVQTVRGDEPSPITVRLQPAAVLTGRAVDDGEPVASTEIKLSYESEAARELVRFLQQQAPPVLTDAEGRFKLLGVLPERRCRLLSGNDRMPRYSEPITTPTAGETQSLGDVVVKSRN